MAKKLTNRKLLKTYADGGNVTNTGDWLTNWMGSRKDILKNNLGETSLKNYFNSNPNAVDDRLNLYKNRIQSTPESINPNLPPEVNGVTYTKGGKSRIEYPVNPDPLSVTHERTHASGIIPDVSNTIKRVTGLDYSGGNKLMDVQTPEELYPRLMEMRQVNQLDPNKQYLPEDVMKFRQINSTQKKNALFDYFDDNTISKLLNEVAMNDIDNTVNMAANGGFLKSYGDGGDVRDFLHKKVGIPLAVNQLFYDISGGEAPITENSLSEKELNELRQGVRNNLKKGKTTLDYGDYGAGSKKLGASNSYNLKTAFEPSINLSRTLGRANINIAGNDTIVTDRYNFNDAAKTRDGKTSIENLKNYAKEAYKTGNNIYFQMRNLGSHFGSPEGEGSPVKINISQKANGGYLKSYATGGEMKKNTNAQFMPTYVSGYPVYGYGGKMQYDLGGMMMPGGVLDVSQYVAKSPELSTGASMGMSAVGQGMEEITNAYRPNKANYGTNIGGGALKGAAMGATLGSFVPGIGTVVGGVAGGIGGALSGLTKSIAKSGQIKQQEEQDQQQQQDMMKQQLISNLPGQQNYTPTFENGGEIMDRVSSIDNGSSPVPGGQSIIK
jgi:hypothetical protein